MSIHENAVIEDGAQIADGVSIGAFCHVGKDVSLAKGVILESHVVVAGHTSVGERTHIFPFASIGHQPQDLKFGGEKTTLEIGTDNMIREHVTMNPGTEGGGSKTIIGNGCLFMMGSHVGHDCIVGDRVILANNATLGGHVILEDHVIIGGLSAIHQFVRIGQHAIIGGMSGIESDVIPYGSAMGERADLAGLNLVGLKRRNFSRDTIHELRGAYRMLFAPEGNLEERIADVKKHFSSNEEVMRIINFIQGEGSRSLCQPKQKG